MNIKKLNSIKLAMVIKDEDVTLIESGEAYYNEIKTRADEILVKAEKEAELLKKQAYDDVVIDLTIKNDELVTNLKHDLMQFLDNTVNDVYSAIYRVLTKFGLVNLNADNLTIIIKEELNNINLSQVLKIVVNNKSIQVLKENQQLSKIVDRIIWEEDNTLNDDECICSTNLWTMRISLIKTLNLILDELN